MCVCVCVGLCLRYHGSLQPVGEICSALRKLEADTGRKERIFVHSDGAQVHPTYTITCHFLPGLWKDSN